MPISIPTFASSFNGDTLLYGTLNGILLWCILLALQTIPEEQFQCASLSRMCGILGYVAEDEETLLVLE